jgi:hypothetical protein
MNVVSGNKMSPVGIPVHPGQVTKGSAKLTARLPEWQIPNAPSPAHLLCADDCSAAGTTAET